MLQNILFPGYTTNDNLFLFFPPFGNSIHSNFLMANVEVIIEVILFDLN